MNKNFGLISLALALAYSGPVAAGDAEAGDKRYHNYAGLEKLKECVYIPAGLERSVLI